MAERDQLIDPLVTVYVTNYNYGKYIAQAVDSVLSQNFANYELIIIDDGSTDNSREIIKRYEGNRKIRIFLQENKGLNATNNIAVRAARGKYVMRLDADDYLDPNALLVMVNALEANSELAMVFPDYYYVDANGKVAGQERRHDFQNEVTLLDQPAHGACSMIRRDCLLEVEAYSEAYKCQDGYDLWLKITDRYTVSNISLPLFYYRRHGNNLTENQELILRTRANILGNHAEKAKRTAISAVAVIPVLGPTFDPYCLSLTHLAGRTLIEWSIDAALAVREIQEIIVTTPDKDLLRIVSERYGNRITVHHRRPEQAMENIPYEAAVHEAVAMRRNLDMPDAVMLLSVDFPLRSSFYLEKAINVMRVFNVDMVIGVFPENDLFYHHAGGGLQPVGNNSITTKMRLERDYLYRQTGGVTLVNKEFYDTHSSNILSGRTGHIVMSREAATPVRSTMDIRIAEAILSKAKA